MRVMWIFFHRLIELGQRYCLGEIRTEVGNAHGGHVGPVVAQEETDNRKLTCQLTFKVEVSNVRRGGSDRWRENDATDESRRRASVTAAAESGWI